MYSQLLRRKLLTSIVVAVVILAITIVGIALALRLCRPRTSTTVSPPASHQAQGANAWFAALAPSSPSRVQIPRVIPATILATSLRAGASPSTRS
jgi:hypothetical protein